MDMEAMGTDITERDLLMLNPKLMLSLGMATDTEAMADTDVTERDPLMLNPKLMLPLLPMLSPDMVMATATDVDMAMAVTAMEDTVDTDITERDLLSPDMDMAVMVDTVDTDMAVGTDMDTVMDIMVEFSFIKEFFCDLSTSQNV